MNMNKNALIMGIIWVCVALAGTFFLIKALAMNDAKSEGNKFWEKAEKMAEKFDDENEIAIIGDSDVSRNGSLKVSAENVFDAQDLKLIKVDCHSAGLIYKFSNDGKIHVNALGKWENNRYPIVDCKNGQLSVKTQRPRFTLFFPGMSRKELEILVPASCLSKDTVLKSSCASGSTKIDEFDVKEIAIESASGSVTLNECIADKIKIESASGSTNLNNCTIGSVQIESASGSLHMSGKYEQLKLESASGSIRIENDIPFTKDSSIEAVSGSVTLVIPEESEYKLRYESVSGRFSDELTGNSGGRTGSVVKGNGSVLLDIETVSGSIKILKK